MTKKNHDPDAAIERLLPAALQAGADGASTDACLDAETLAAWADEALDARERKAAEAHAAGCGRCQALMAAMVRTAPPTIALSSASAKRSWWWMVVAMTPVAAALVVWFAVPKRAPVQQSESASAIVDQATPASPAPARPVPPDEAQSNAPAKAPEEAAPQSAPAKTRTAAEAEQKIAPSASERSNVSADAEARTAAAAAPAAAPAAPAAAAADVAQRRESLAVAGRLSAFANPLDSVIVSSNPATRFRLLPGGGVQRSADGGATWRSEVTGATETLTAGASPSPSVCWLIGPAGTVLLSTDGRSWQRLTFPEAADLRSITAADGENATVTTVDGRAFATTDGGRTWARPPDF